MIRPTVLYTARILDALAEVRDGAVRAPMDMRPLSPLSVLVESWHRTPGRVNVCDRMSPNATGASMRTPTGGQPVGFGVASLLIDHRRGGVIHPACAPSRGRAAVSQAAASMTHSSAGTR